MSYLTLDADQLVRDAVDAYLEGRTRPDAGGDCVFATRNSQYRVVEGTVQEASDTSLMGAELVGWLVEELGQPMIESRWRPYGRAIFVERRSRHVVVTSRTITRTTVSGNVPPVPPLRRMPSVIPAAPPIPVLKASAPPPGPDGSPTPFKLTDALRQAANRFDSAPPQHAPPQHAPPQHAPPQHAPAPSANERPTARPPSDEATIAADRASYDELLESTRTPTNLRDPVKKQPPAEQVSIPRPPPVPPPAPARPINLPPPGMSQKGTLFGPGPSSPGRSSPGEAPPPSERPLAPPPSVPRPSSKAPPPDDDDDAPLLEISEEDELTE